ncbi:MAG: hypothetical protein WCS72_19145, partial [Deltaproteobacteria bacterium]
MLQATYLESTSGAVREWAARSAASRGGPEEARWLARLASTDERSGAVAGVALGSMGSGAAAEALAEVAAGRQPVIARANAA